MINHTNLYTMPMPGPVSPRTTNHFAASRALCGALLACQWLPTFVSNPLVAQEPAPAAAAPTEPIRYLVTLRDRSFDLQPLRMAILQRTPGAELEAILTQLDARTLADQAGFAGFVTDELGGKVLQQWWIISGCLVQVAPEQLPRLRAHPRVDRVDRDELRLPTGPIRTSTNGSNHRTDSVHALSIFGHRSAVAIVDTGQDSNMAGAGRPHSVYFPDGNPSLMTGLGIGGSRLVNNVQFGAMSADDTHGHGTAVASVAAGAQWNPSFSADNGHAPKANLIGYAIADLPNGSAYFSTMIAAWQSVAQGRGVERTLAANMSYSGSPDPTHPANQASDSVALNADVLVAVGAGNSGPDTTQSQGLTNGLAVGSIASNSHIVSGFSARGPLSGDPGRNYPDVVAIGDYVTMAQRDAESSNYSGSGTSFASPHVAGAAILYRSMANTTALEAKAAILATAASISTQNPGLGINDYGQGMLRVDRLVDVARGNAFRGHVTLSAGSPSTVLEFWVDAGVTYDAAIAWPRHNLAANSPSDINLEIEQGGVVIASSATPRNTYERARFVATQTGLARLRILSSYLEPTQITIAYVVPNARPVGTPVWRQVRTATRPPVHADHSMVYDAARGVTVLFGGDNLTTASDETWEYNGTTWTRRFPTTSPSPRIAFSMGYDPIRQRVVVFGGLTYHGGAWLNDTWEYNGTTWTQITPTTSPSPRAAAEFAFDYTRNELLLFSGENAGNDTWVWNGQRWLQLATANAPSPRMHAAMASDPHNGWIMLFGGRTNAGGFDGETWIWTGSTWLQLVPTLSPPPASDMAFGFDSDRGRMILSGGWTHGYVHLSNTWEWDGAGWMQRIEAPPYASGSDPVASWHGAWDSVRRRFVVFGGRNGSAAETPRFGPSRDETWEYFVPFAALATNFGGNCPSSGGSNTLVAQRLPWLGSTYVGRATGLPGLALVCSVFGFGSAFVPLPLILPQGQPGCYLRTTPDFVDVLVATAGTATWQAAIPSTTSLLGAQPYHQMLPLQVDAQLNIIAMTSTNALRLFLAAP